MRATSSPSVSVSTVGPTSTPVHRSRGTRRTRREDLSANSAGSRLRSTGLSSSFGEARRSAFGAKVAAVSALIVSLGVVDRARLPNDGHFDLARVFELVLDA